MKEELSKDIDVRLMNKLVDAVTDTISHGYGKVTFEVVVQSGNIVLVSLTKSETYKT